MHHVANGRRASGLRTFFADLRAYLESTNQKIHDTHYTVLERMQAIDGMMDTLAQIEGLWRDVNEGLGRETNGIGLEIQLLLDGLGDFVSQRHRIEALRERIQNCATRTSDLGDRVDSVRRTVEAWEHRDAQWQEQTRRRLKFIWILILCACAVILAMVIGAQYSGNRASLNKGPQHPAVAQDSDHGRDAEASMILRALDEL
jgi:FtsZ-binding cell division protein ZapB